MPQHLTSFVHDKFGEIRVADRNGDPWFLAMDICRPLGIRTDNLRAILDKDEVCEIDPYTIGVTSYGKKVLLISLPGVFSLLNKSRKPEAKPFQRWVNHEVLPSIYRTGGYVTPAVLDKITRDPEEYLTLLQEWKRERERRRLVEDCFDLIKPRTRFGEISDLTGRPKTKLIPSYYKTPRAEVEIITIRQRSLFDLLDREGEDDDDE